METPSSSRRVVVTGLGAITSLGHEVDAFWKNVVAGRCGVSRVTLFDPKDSACQIGAEVRNWEAAQHMDPKEARRNDRYTHFGFVAAKQAVRDSGLDMAKEASPAARKAVKKTVVKKATAKAAVKRVTKGKVAAKKAVKKPAKARKTLRAT